MNSTLRFNVPARAAAHPAPALASFLAGAARKVQSFLSMPAPGVPEASAQLLRLAQAYEETQPSYAADLRAAASMADHPSR